MVGGRTRTVKAALLLLAFSGCFWREYGRAAATHAALLDAMAHKGADLVTSGRFTAESMPELTYPLERAQAFVRAARARAGDAPPPSLVALESLVERYVAFVDLLDRVRRTAEAPDTAATLAPPLAALGEAHLAVRKALAAEERL